MRSLQKYIKRVLLEAEQHQANAAAIALMQQVAQKYPRDVALIDISPIGLAVFNEALDKEKRDEFYDAHRRDAELRKSLRTHCLFQRGSNYYMRLFIVPEALRVHLRVDLQDAEMIYAWYEDDAIDDKFKTKAINSKQLQQCTTLSTTAEELKEMLKAI